MGGASKTSIPTRKLATLLTFALASLSVVVLILVSVPLLYTYFQSSQETIAVNQQFIAQNAARTVENYIEQRLNMLLVGTKLSDLIAETPQRQTTALQSLLGQDTSLMRLLLLDSQGQTLAQASRLSLASAGKLDAQEIDAILSYINKDESYISPVSINAITSEPEVFIAVPATNLLGDLNGALVATVNLKFMWKLVGEMDVGEEGVVYVVDRQGNLLAFGDTTGVLSGENVAHIQAVHAFAQSSAATQSNRLMRYQGIVNTDVVGMYVGLGTPDWAVITEMPWSVAYRNVRNYIGLALGIIITAAAFAGAIGYFLARRLTLPILRLMKTADRIAAGERDLQASLDGPHEIASLARAFNVMTGQLRSTLEGLEQRVNQRTTDLQLALTEVETRAHEQSRLLDALAQQRQVIRELSVPVLPVTAECLVVPLIGVIDSERLGSIQERALQVLERSPTRFLLLDITGVPVVDGEVAQGLLKIATMTRLLGCETILIGIRPEVAQSIVGLGLDLNVLRTAVNLQAALSSFIR